jgi:hypothetical protein
LQVFFEVKAIGLAHRLVALAAAAAEVSGYLGDWALAFGATGLMNSYSHFLSIEWSEGSPYPEDVYTDSVVASYSELVKRPWEIVDSLAGGLLRGFNTRQNFLYALTSPTPRHVLEAQARPRARSFLRQLPQLGFTGDLSHPSTKFKGWMSSERGSSRNRATARSFLPAGRRSNRISRRLRRLPSRDMHRTTAATRERRTSERGPGKSRSPVSDFATDTGS